MDDTMMSHPSSTARRKRRRPALSCEPCRRRKVRCDRNMPCTNCVRARDVDIVCTYQMFEPLPPRPRRSLPAPGSQRSAGGRGWPAPRPESEALAIPDLAVVGGPSAMSADSGPLPSGGPPETRTTVASRDISTMLDGGFSVSQLGLPSCPLSSAEPVTRSESIGRPDTTITTTTTGAAESSATPNSSLTSSTYGNLMERVRQLEAQLSEKLTLQDTTQCSGEGGAINTVPVGKLNLVTAPLRGAISKTRLFGLSHWTNGVELFPIFIQAIQNVASDCSNEAYRVIQQCKALVKIIKSRRAPSLTNNDVGQRIPSREVADKLVQAYLRSFESVMRILHVPTFKKEYELYWANPHIANDSFIVLLQLVMAIGACFYDDRFTLRTNAIQWIQEALFWLSSPFEKQRLTIQGIQIMCLLHFARETCAVSGDLVWISAGSLVRYAMMMGLHRDPSKLGDMSILRAEIRRRLWSVILEIALHSCVDAGGPPLIRIQDFDARSPSNLNDDQLTDVKDMPRVDECEFTETSMQIALMHSFPTRLSIASYLNNISSLHSYDETLRLNAELTKAIRKLALEMQSFCKRDGTGPRPSPFQISLVELLTHRFVLALHLPVLIQHLRDPGYYFSRKLCVNAALKLYTSTVPTTLDSSLDPLSYRPVGTTEYNPRTEDFTRLCTNGSGPFRSIPIQSIITLRLELQLQVEEDDPFGLIPSSNQRQDLLAAMKSGAAWSLRRIKSGETNPKGHVSISTLGAQVEYLAIQKVNGVDVLGSKEESEIQELVVKAGALSAERAFKELKEVAVALGIDVGQEFRPHDDAEGKGKEKEKAFDDVSTGFVVDETGVVGNMAGAGVGANTSTDFAAWNSFDFTMQDESFTTNFWQDLMLM